MYLGKLKLKNPEQYEDRRAFLIAEKSGAIFTAFAELDGTVNKTRLAADYFDRSPAWLAHKIHGATVCNKVQSFSEQEAHCLAEAFRDIACRLLAHAAEIDAAAPDESAPATDQDSLQP